MTLYERDDFVERLRYRATVWRYLKLVVSGWWADRQAYARRRRGMIELAEMEDWQLRDIGVERSEDRAGAQMVKTIWQDVQSACDELGVTICGGHTEISLGIPRPILCGQMIGEAAKKDITTNPGIF